MYLLAKSLVMKPILTFIRTTLIGGIFFLLPIYLIFMLLYKVHLVATKILAPLTHFLPENILGMNAGRLVGAFGLVLLCFIAGILFKMSFIKKGIQYLEDRVLSHIPGYSQLKSKTSDTFGEKIDYYSYTVLVEEQQSWRIGLLIEEKDGLCTVYFPKAPKNDSGDVEILPAQFVTKVDVSTKEALLYLKSFGKGCIQWIKKT
jgi:uncharacterized membrane protein